MITVQSDQLGNQADYVAVLKMRGKEGGRREGGREGGRGEEMEGGEGEERKWREGRGKERERPA